MQQQEADHTHSTALGLGKSATQALQQVASSTHETGGLQKALPHPGHGSQARSRATLEEQQGATHHLAGTAQAPSASGTGARAQLPGDARVQEGRLRPWSAGGRERGVLEAGFPGNCTPRTTVNSLTGLSRASGINASVSVTSLLACLLKGFPS